MLCNSLVSDRFRNMRRATLLRREDWGEKWVGASLKRAPLWRHHSKPATCVAQNVGFQHTWMRAHTEFTCTYPHTCYRRIHHRVFAAQNGAKWLAAGLSSGPFIVRVLVYGCSLSRCSVLWFSVQVLKFPFRLNFRFQVWNTFAQMAYLWSRLRLAVKC